MGSSNFRSDVPKIISGFLALPVVTRFAVVVCVAIYGGLAWVNDYENWDTLSAFGYVPAMGIWEGQVWGLLTSVFVHFEFWHLFFNVYWLWVLGSRMEAAIGAWRFLAFFVLAAVISSTLELAATDSTGIGASGVVYAIFGFMWIARRRFAQFDEVITQTTTQLFLIWLVVCVLITQLGIMEIGNVAHVSGLAFGVLAAAAFAIHRQASLAIGGLMILIALSIGVLCYCPWSPSWLSVKAYQAHAAERYEKALQFYSRLLKQDPKNAWALENRSYVYTALGDMRLAKLDHDAALRINPSLKETE